MKVLAYTTALALEAIGMVLWKCRDGLEVAGGFALAGSMLIYRRIKRSEMRDAGKGG
jgi:hypothetical protein